MLSGSLCLIAVVFVCAQVCMGTLIPTSSIPNYGMTEQVAEPWCSRNTVVLNGTLLTITNATLLFRNKAPVHLVEPGWRFGMTESEDVIMSPSGFSGQQLDYTFALSHDDSVWRPVFRDIPLRRKAGVGASATHYFIAGGNDPTGSGLETDDVFWANATSLQTVGMYNMSNSRPTFVEIHKYGRGIAISGGSSFTQIDFFDEDTSSWYVGNAGVGGIRFPAIASVHDHLYIAGGQFVDTSLGGNGGESLDIWRFSGFPPTAMRVGGLVYGARRSTMTILGNYVYVIGGEAYRTGLCCRTDTDAPSRIQEIHTISGQVSTYQNYLPLDWDSVSACSSDQVYTFNVDGSAYAFARNGAAEQNATLTPPEEPVSDGMSSSISSSGKVEMMRLLSFVCFGLTMCILS